MIDLNTAAFRGDIDAVRRMLNAGADIDARDRGGWTPLLRAIQQRRINVAALLIERGANVLFTDRRGRAALHWTAQYGTAALTRTLIERGAQACAVDLSGKSPLVQAIIHGRLDVLHILLPHYVARWQRGSIELSLRAPVLLAVSKGRGSALRAILALAAESGTANLWGDGSFWFTMPTPLMMAARRQRADLAQILIDYGADCRMVNDDRGTAMAECLKSRLRSGRTNPVQALLERSGVVFGISDAVVAGDAYLTQVALSSGADVESLDKNEQSLLGWSAKHGDLKIARVLMEGGAKIDSRDRGGRTPLMEAADAGSLDLLRLLVDRGADPELVTRHHGSALASAAFRGHRDIVEWLLVNYPCEMSRNGALIAAAEGGRSDVIRRLLDAGAEVNAVGNMNRTALIWAAWRGDVEITRLLLDRGATTLRDEALRFAVGAGKLSTAMVLLQSGLGQAAVDASLREAVRCRRWALMPALLAAGGDPNITTGPE
jgi:ankyrin repeat protein